MKSDKKILVVDDERPLSKALSLKLENNGYKVDIANNGEEALDKLKADKFDMLILDLVMPVIDGFKVLAQMKDLNISIPTIVTSNLSQEEDREKVKVLGAVYYFVKSDSSLSDIVNYINNYFK